MTRVARILTWGWRGLSPGAHLVYPSFMFTAPSPSLGSGHLREAVPQKNGKNEEREELWERAVEDCTDIGELGWECGGLVGGWVTHVLRWIAGKVELRSVVVGLVLGLGSGFGNCFADGPTDFGIGHELGDSGIGTSVEKILDKPVVLPMDGDTVIKVVAQKAKPWSKKGVGVTLELLPLAVLGKEVDSGERAVVEAAIRMGAGVDSLYWVWTAEETDVNAVHSVGGLRDCFTERCLQSALRRLGHGSGLVLAGQYARKDSSVTLKLVLLESEDGRLHSALEAKRILSLDSSDNLVHFVSEAATRLVTEKSAPGFVLTFSAWREIPWLNLRDTIDHRERIGFVGTGMLLAATGLALVEGQLLQADHRIQFPNGEILAADRIAENSFLRGFFSSPALSPRFAAMGGAGIAEVSNGLALLMNPAGVAAATCENVIAAKGTLPDGSPTVYVGYAGPLYRAWSQGLGVYFQGDGLASETTIHGALGFDLESVHPSMAGVKVGVGVKLYLADVGRDGNGIDKVTGYSVGTGLNLGLHVRVNEKITAALSIHDVASIINHTNTFTDQRYHEVLPPEYRIGTAYKVSESLLLLLDGQKALLYDQDDHVKMGLEKTVFRFLAIRLGLHQIFGGTAVRKFTVGFGMNTDPISEGARRTPVALNYGYEFAISNDEPLGGGQQFSLELGF